MQANAGVYSLADREEEEVSPARIDRDSPQTSEGKHLTVLILAPEAAKAARLTAAQDKANQVQWDALTGIRCGAGLSPKAMAAGKAVAAGSLDIQRLQRNGQKVRSAAPEPVPEPEGLT